ncbi:MAG: hypothetical protein AB1498_01720 [bacterium]
MRIMKRILISFIVVNLAFQGFLSSIFAAEITGEIEKLNITLEVRHMLEEPRPAEFTIKVKPLTINEQVLLKTIEAKTHSLLDQAAGRYYDDTYKNPRAGNPSPFINNPITIDIIHGAVIGAFIGWLTSSGKDIASVRKSTRIGALCGSVIIWILYLF